MYHGLTSSSHIYTIQSPPPPTLVVSKVGTYSKLNQLESLPWNLASRFCTCTHCKLIFTTPTSLAPQGPQYLPPGPFSSVCGSLWARPTHAHKRFCNSSQVSLLKLPSGRSSQGSHCCPCLWIYCFHFQGAVPDCPQGFIPSHCKTYCSSSLN